MADNEAIEAARTYIEISERVMPQVDALDAAMDERHDAVSKHPILRSLHPEVFRTDRRVYAEIGHTAVALVRDGPAALKSKRALSKLRTPEQKADGVRPREIALEILSETSQE